LIHKAQQRKLYSHALVLHLARNLARQVVAQGTAICEVQMQHRALALFLPLLDCFQVTSQFAQQSTQLVS
jgi:hypothetical protein